MRDPDGVLNPAYLINGSNEELAIPTYIAVQQIKENGLRDGTLSAPGQRQNTVVYMFTYNIQNYHNDTDCSYKITFYINTFFIHKKLEKQVFFYIFRVCRKLATAGAVKVSGHFTGYGAHKPVVPGLRMPVSFVIKTVLAHE